MRVVARSQVSQSAAQPQPQRQQFANISEAQSGVSAVDIVRRLSIAEENIRRLAVALQKSELERQQLAAKCRTAFDQIAAQLSGVAISQPEAVAAAPVAAPVEKTVAGSVRVVEAADAAFYGGHLDPDAVMYGDRSDREDGEP